MSSLDGLIVSSFAKEGFTPGAIGRVIIRSSIYFVVASKYLGYLNIFFAYRETQNIVYHGLGYTILNATGAKEWISVQVAAQIFAIFTYTAKCIETTKCLSEKYGNLRKAIRGYDVLPPMLNPDQQWKVSWIPPSFENWVHLKGGYYKKYLYNLAWRCGALGLTALELITYINTLIATAMWVAETKSQNVDMIAVNLDYLIKKVATELPSIQTTLEERQDKIQEWLTYLHSPLKDASTILTAAKTVTTICTGANYLLDPMRGKTSDVLARGGMIGLDIFGLGNLFRSYLPNTSDDALESGSPFDDLPVTQASE